MYVVETKQPYKMLSPIYHTTAVEMIGVMGVVSTIYHTRGACLK
jgi:hypothetical protein